MKLAGWLLITSKTCTCISLGGGFINHPRIAQMLSFHSGYHNLQLHQRHSKSKQTDKKMSSGTIQADTPLPQGYRAGCQGADAHTSGYAPTVPSKPGPPAPPRRGTARDQTSAGKLFPRRGVLSPYLGRGIYRPPKTLHGATLWRGRKSKISAVETFRSCARCDHSPAARFAPHLALRQMCLLANRA